MLLLLSLSSGTEGIALADLLTYEMVNIGDAGNAADTNGTGSVHYAYRMGRTEVTIGQWVTFLNAVAASDPNELYSDPMATDLNIAGIVRTGSPGSFHYSALDNEGDSSNRPVTYVSWWDAARLANWLSNGQPAGGQTASTTENGAYDLINIVPWIAPARNVVNPNTGSAPTYFVPTTDEWYKAAYYSPVKNGLGSPGYWRYATQSDSEPGNYVGNLPNQANFVTASGPATTHSTDYSSPHNYLTDVGAFTASASWYGTFDQSGNVWEWTDLDGTPNAYRGWDGGNWAATPAMFPSSNRIERHSGSHYSQVGFRLAGTANVAVPEISSSCILTVTALLIGAAGIVEKRRSRTGIRIKATRLK